MADAEAIQIELTTDPLIRGYAQMSDQEAYTSLRVKDRPSSLRVSGAELLGALDKAAYAALDADKKSQVLALASADGVTADVVEDIFGASTTLTAFQALSRIDRATEIGQQDIRVGHVSSARSR